MGGELSLNWEGVSNNKQSTGSQVAPKKKKLFTRNINFQTSKDKVFTNHLLKIVIPTEYYKLDFIIVL